MGDTVVSYVRLEENFAITKPAVAGSNSQVYKIESCISDTYHLSLYIIKYYHYMILSWLTGLLKEVC